jgi:SAM-dependent methyltransferase
MIADRPRVEAYAQAIAKAVGANDIVLDVGCGPGVFALLACRAGARKVYAIDSDEIVHFVRELAAANAIAAERIEFIQGDSRKVQLPERVDVIVSDIRGSLPFFGHAIASLEDARRRLLVPGGRIIPQRDTLKAALIEAKDFYSRLVSPWSLPNLGLDLSPSLPRLLNGSYSSQFGNEQLLTDSQIWAVLDYSVGAKASAAADMCFSVGRPGIAHGLCLWFDTELFENIGYSSAPGPHKTIYGQVFLPWSEAVSVQKGQQVSVRLQSNLVGEDYIWRWETQIYAGAKNSTRHFQQSTFLGINFTPSSLRRRASDFVPSLTEEGETDRWFLHAMDGKATLQQIAQAAAQQFPTIFPRWEDALRRAAELASHFSR